MLRCHHQLKGDDDVGLPGADGAGTSVARQQVAQGVCEATFDPVAHHHPGAGLGRGKEAGGCRYWLTHQFILGRPARFAGTGWGIIGSDVNGPALLPDARAGGEAGTQRGEARDVTYVIAQPCVDVKDKACIEECPVDCIYEGERSLYIHPDECVDCGACEPVCPVEAIYYEDDTPEEWADYYKANVEFFDDLGSPGGAAKIGNTGKDHPMIAALPPQNQDH